MTNKVETINDAIKARVALVLPTYTEMTYVLNVESNNERNSVNRYGVRPLGADSSPGAFKRVTFNQRFEIILIDLYKNRDNDTKQRDASFVLYDKMDDIIADLMGSKAGIPDTILLVSDPSIDEPEYPEGEDVAILRGSVNIQWRRNI